MTPAKILSAIELGQSAFDKKHGALRLLWRKFGQSVRNRRRELGISLKDFSAQLSYSRGMVSFLEAGKREWPLDKARKAAEILKQ